MCPRSSCCPLATLSAEPKKWHQTSISPWLSSSASALPAPSVYCWGRPRPVLNFAICLVASSTLLINSQMHTLRVSNTHCRASKSPSTKCFLLADISRDSKSRLVSHVHEGWIARRAPPGGRSQYRGQLQSIGAPPLHLGVMESPPHPRSTPIIPSGPHLWWAGGLRCHFHKLLTQTEQPRRTAKWPVNSDTTAACVPVMGVSTKRWHVMRCCEIHDETTRICFALIFRTHVNVYQNQLGLIIYSPQRIHIKARKHTIQLRVFTV